MERGKTIDEKLGITYEQSLTHIRLFGLHKIVCYRVSHDRKINTL